MVNGDGQPPPLPPPPPPPQQLNAVGIRPPPFEEQSVARWFAVLESQFSIAHISVSSTKFNHVLSHLPMSVVNKLSDNILQNADYDELKDRLIELFSKSAPELFESLISKSACYSKPSLYLQEIRRIAEPLKITDEFVKCKFLKALPDNIRPMLVASEHNSLDEMARVADTLIAYDSSKSAPVYNVNPKSSFNANSHYSNRQFNKSGSNGQGYNNFHSSSSSSHSQTNSQIQYSDSTIPLAVRSYHSKQRPQVCRSHIYYGSRAKTCKPWCLLASSSPNLQMQPNSRPNSRSSSPIPNYDPSSRYNNNNLN